MNQTEFEWQFRTPAYKPDNFFSDPSQRLLEIKNNFGASNIEELHIFARESLGKFETFSIKFL